VRVPSTSTCTRRTGETEFAPCLCVCVCVCVYQLQVHRLIQEGQATPEFCVCVCVWCVCVYAYISIYAFTEHTHTHTHISKRRMAADQALVEGNLLSDKHTNSPAPLHNGISIPTTHTHTHTYA
jgi:hypothetical protein